MTEKNIIDEVIDEVINTNDESVRSDLIGVRVPVEYKEVYKKIQNDISLSKILSKIVCIAIDRTKAKIEN